MITPSPSLSLRLVTRASAACHLNTSRDSECLTGVFPPTLPAGERLTGVAFCRAAAAQFIEANPPRSGCFDDYGENFSTFLASLPIAATPYLTDVASLEWAINKALRAADVAPLQRRDLETASLLDPARVVLRPHPSLS